VDAGGAAWVLWSWVLLGLGILLGARWAYTELGWGGYWAWDPVENVSLLPWLTATAYLHTAVLQERRGKLPVVEPRAGHRHLRADGVRDLPGALGGGLLGPRLRRVRAPASTCSA
jgi:hypothetical protein